MSSSVYAAYVFVVEALRMPYFKRGHDCDISPIYLDCNGKPIPIYHDLRSAYESIGYSYSSHDQALGVETSHKTDIAISVDYPEYQFSAKTRFYELSFEVSLLMRVEGSQDRVVAIRDIEENIFDRLRFLRSFKFLQDRGDIPNPFLSLDDQTINVETLHSIASSGI